LWEESPLPAGKKRICRRQHRLSPRESFASLLDPGEKPFAKDLGNDKALKRVETPG
jgi:hypothetical protein